MTEEKLNERLEKILTHDELMNVDAYYSRRYGLCVDVYLDGIPAKRVSRFIRNIKAVAMGHADVRIMKSLDYDRDEVAAFFEHQHELAG